MNKILLYTAIGDAIGAGYEFTYKKVKSFDDIKGYNPHPKRKNSPKDIGVYTDDTHMSIGNAIALIELFGYKKLNNFNTAQIKRLFADNYLAVYRFNPRTGYAKGFQSLLESLKKHGTGQTLIDKIQKHGKSDRNGAAMRAVVLGYLPLGVLSEITRIQSSVTHNDAGNYAASIISLLSYYLKVMDKERAYKALSLVYPNAFLYGRELPPCPVSGIKTVAIALELFYRNNNLKDLIIDAINVTGDVDSLLAITCGLAAWPNSGYDLTLPQWCFDNLEDGLLGRSYINVLDSQLYNAFK